MKTERTKKSRGKDNKEGKLIFKKIRIKKEKKKITDRK